MENTVTKITRTEKGVRYVAASLPKSNEIVECPIMGRGRVVRLTHDNCDNYITIQWIGMFADSRYRFSLRAS